MPFDADSAVLNAPDAPATATSFEPDTATFNAADDARKKAKLMPGMTQADADYLTDLGRSAFKGTEPSFESKHIEPVLEQSMRGVETPESTAESVKLSSELAPLGAGVAGVPQAVAASVGDKPSQVLSGLYNGLKTLPEALTAPITMVLAPLGVAEGAGSVIGKAIGKAVQVYFAGDMAKSGGQESAEAMRVLTDKNATLEDKVKAVTKAASALGFSALIGAHAGTKGEGPTPAPASDAAAEARLPETRTNIREAAGVQGPEIPPGERPLETPPKFEPESAVMNSPDVVVAEAPKFEPDTATLNETGEKPPAATTDVAPETAAREDVNAQLERERRETDRLKREAVDAALKDPETMVQYNVWDRAAVPEGSSRVLQVDLPSPNAPETAGTRNYASTSLEDLRARGLDLPEPPESLPPGRYTLDEIRAAIEKERQPAPEAETLPPAAPVGETGELPGANAEFNLAGEEQRAAEAPPEDAGPTNFDLFDPETVRSMPPSALDEANARARELAQAPGEPEQTPPVSTGTQAERVEAVLKSGEPKTARQLADQLDIIHHNVRRILGEGAKAGKFERLAPGVYGMKGPKGNHIYVESTDAVKALPGMADRGVQADFIFLDPPYRTNAVVGGNRGIKEKNYQFITPDQFNTVVAAAKRMARTPETPIYYMFSTAPSGMRQMNAYTEAFERNGFKRVGLGSWTKTTKEGKPHVNQRGVPMAPEGIAVYTQSGTLPKGGVAPDMDFHFERPAVAGKAGRISQKPLELYDALLGRHVEEAAPGERHTFTSLDPFAGTGGLAEASQRRGISNISLEIDDDVVNKFIKPRLEKAASEESSIFGEPGEGEKMPASAPKRMSAADRARMAAHERENLEQSMPQGTELLDAVRGKLPRPENVKVLKGEVQRIWDNLTTEKKIDAKLPNIKDPRARKGYVRKDVTEAVKFFAGKDVGGDLDTLRQSINEQGFNFQTSDEMLNAIEASMRGEKLYASEGSGIAPQFEGKAPPIKVNETEAAPKPVVENSILEVMRKRAEAAQSRLKDKWTGGRASAGLDPTVLKDMAEIGAYHVARGVVGAAEWTKAMVDQFGEKIRPYLTQIRAESEKLLSATDPENAPKISGVANRVNAQLEAAGYIGEVPHGTGIDPATVSELGRKLMDAGTDPEQVMQHFEQTGQSSLADIAVSRAHYDELAEATYAARDQYGMDSPEFKAASDAQTDWARRFQAMKTDFARRGHSLQGEVDLDTGDFRSMREHYLQTSGKDFNPKEAKVVETFAEDTKRVRREVKNAEGKLYDEWRKSEPREEAQSIADRITAALDREAAAALKRIRQRMAGGQLYSGIPLDALGDYVVYGAAKIAKFGVEKGQWAADMVRDLGEHVKPHLDDLWKRANEYLDREAERGLGTKKEREAVAKALKEPRKQASVTKTPKMEKITPTAEEARKQGGLPGIEQPNIEPDNPLKQGRAVAGNAEEQARQGSLPGIEKPAVEPDVATSKKGAVQPNAEEQARQMGLEGVEKPAVVPDQPTSRKGVAKPDARERAKQMSLDEVGNTPSYSDVRELAKRYLDEGETDFDKIRAKIAQDTGLDPEDIYKALAGRGRERALSDDLYRKLSEQRRISDAARNYLDNLNKSLPEKAVDAAFRALFQLYTIGHGTVAGTTHAIVNLLNPASAGRWITEFMRSFRLMGLHDKGAYHERMMREMEQRPNYIKAQRAGLANGVERIYDDYQSGWLRSWFRRIGLAGNRGFDSLKLLRQSLFDREWDKLPDSLKTDDYAKILADSINHATGVVKTRLWKVANWTFFAPKLELSRWAWLVKDPAKAAEIGMRIVSKKPVTMAERMFAKRELLQKTTIATSYMTLLGINQALLAATGSPQRINFTNPHDPDFLAFKGFGYRLGIAGPMLGAVRLAWDLGRIGFGDRTKEEKKDSRWEEAGQEIWKYVRNKLSPLAGIGADVYSQADYMRRPLPFSNDRIPAHLRRQGYEPYTYAEYAATRMTPIPVSHAARELYRQREAGTSKAAHIAEGVGSGILTGTTGFRLDKDWERRRR